jgi:glycosyltransferase involved in cell wall biosynthesis
MGIPPIWIGRSNSPILRLFTLNKYLREYTPHILQSTHFYTNLHVAILAPFHRSISIGSIRNDTIHELKANGRWGPFLLKTPSALIANSYAGKLNAIELGIDERTIHVLPNVIDLDDFDQRFSQPSTQMAGKDNNTIKFISITRLVYQKRVEYFLEALAQARTINQKVSGVVVGDGPERARLTEIAQKLNLIPEGVVFLGERDDIPTLLKSADVLVLSSDHEGFSNVLLEAMSASLPVITTPAGDAGVIVQDQINGCVVQRGDVDSIVKAMLSMAGSPGLRKKMGQKSRQRVEQLYSYQHLRHNLLKIYQEIARQQGKGSLLNGIDLGYVN